MNARGSIENCAVILLAEGFDEVEAVGILTALRAAGVCVKSLGLTGGLITGRHGLLLMPDYALFNLSDKFDVSAINAVILPGTKRCLTRLETDPRVHRLLRQVIAQRGLVATNAQGYGMLKRTLGQENATHRHRDRQIMLRASGHQPIDVFAQTIVQRLECL